jgi:hypothetical protein
MGVFHWVDRETYPGQGLFNADTEGCLPTRMLLAESDDSGHSWSAFREVPMPEVIGPPSLTNPLIILADGTLVMSVESNKTYQDDSTWYQRVVMFHSTDQGQTWGEPAIAGFDPSGRIYNWDQRVGLAPDGRLGAFLWTYDSHMSTYHNIHRRISADGGHTWTQAEDLGFPLGSSCPMAMSSSSTTPAAKKRWMFTGRGCVSSDEAEYLEQLNSLDTVGSCGHMSR